MRSAILVGRLEGSGEITEELDEKHAKTVYKVVEHARSLKHDWITKVRPTAPLMVIVIPQTVKCKPPFDNKKTLQQVRGVINAGRSQSLEQ